ncbi:MAG: hypothetical protein Q7S77_01140 [Candidatus Staskawiczbacteria bacterium]|nr:hypothetical protein [Candidatus Staskawiczbacteria bacterium]
MWIKLLILFLLFGLFGILQTSFFIHFNIIGATLNLIFILFFLTVFFEEQKKYIQGIFSAIVAGFFLDIFSSFYIGISIASLLVIAFAIKYIIYLLKKKRDRYPIVYFAPLFILFFIIYNLFLTITVYFSSSPHIIPTLSLVFLVEIFYNLFFAILGFFIYKKFKFYEF